MLSWAEGPYKCLSVSAWMQWSERGGECGGGGGKTTVGRKNFRVFFLLFFSWGVGVL